LTVAHALERYAGEAVHVTLIDKNSGVSDYEGVEYAIQERACLALERMGIKDAALRRGNPMREFSFYDERRNKKQMSVSKDPRYCFEVFRQHFLYDLEALLQTTKVRRNSLVTGLSFKSDDESGAVSVQVKSVGGEGVGEGDGESELPFDVVVACEGLHSSTRRQLFPDESTIKEYDFHILYTLVEAKEGDAMPPHFREIANGSYLQFNMSRSTTNSFFPLGENRLAIAIIFNSAARHEVWERLGLDVARGWGDLDADAKKKVAAELAADTKVFDNLFTNLIELVPDWDSKRIYSWSMRDTDALSRPHALDCNAVLIGDAAHAMLPCLGEGANTAIEDGEALGRLLADFAKSGWTHTTLKRDLESRVFAPFARARVSVWRDLVDRSRRAIPNFSGQQTVTGFTVAPYIPIPIVAYAFSIGEWFRDLMGRRGY
ncbi:hypothetical protein HK405_009007, partial [Cladochytrium tenue]